MSVYDFNHYHQKRKDGRFPSKENHRWRDKPTPMPPVSPTVDKFKVGEYYINPKMGVSIHVIGITNESKVYSDKPVYVIEASDSDGDFWAMFTDDERIKEWHACTEEVFMKLLYEDPDKEPPPEVG